MANSTDGVLLDYRDPLNFTVTCLLLVIGVFGVVCNTSIVYIFYKEKSERTSFNLICVFRSLSNLYILATTFLGLFLPKTVLGFSPFSPPVESTLIHISNTLYLGNEYQIILVAINRFIAMFLPVHYLKICGFKTTLIILTAIYLFRIAVVIWETIPQLENQCYTIFNIELLAWKYDPQKKCEIEDNILTSNKSEDHETKRRIRRNIALFFQTALQDSLYLIDLSFMIKLSQLSDARLWSYISGTFVWECLHSIDGFIMIMFNERLSLLRKRFFNSPSSTHLPSKKFTTSAVSVMPAIG